MGGLGSGEPSLAGKERGFICEFQTAKLQKGFSTQLPRYPERGTFHTLTFPRKRSSRIVKQFL
eukprot:scaffold109941_cov19-Tisochrysis_lutea.AAC.1